MTALGRNQATSASAPRVDEEILKGYQVISAEIPPLIFSHPFIGPQSPDKSF
jgi:hypothetical protein